MCTPEFPPDSGLFWPVFAAVQSVGAPPPRRPWLPASAVGCELLALLLLAGSRVEESGPGRRQHQDCQPASQAPSSALKDPGAQRLQ